MRLREVVTEKSSLSVCQSFARTNREPLNRSRSLEAADFVLHWLRHRCNDVPPEGVLSSTSKLMLRAQGYNMGVPG